MKIKFTIIPTGQIDYMEMPMFRVERFENGQSIGFAEISRAGVQKEIVDTLKTMLNQGEQVEVEFT